MDGLYFNNCYLFGILIQRIKIFSPVTLIIINIFVNYQFKFDIMLCIIIQQVFFMSHMKK